MLDELISIAKAEIGISETGTNVVKYNDWYWGTSYRSNGADYPWCVVFCAWICDQAGISFPHVAHCNQVESYAKSHQQWYTSDYRIGDFIIFDYDRDGNRDHIGFVVDVRNGSLFTIEGNYGDKVSEVKRSPSEVIGAYRPDYKYPAAVPAEDADESSSADEKIPATFPELHIGDTKPAVGIVQLILKYMWGCSMKNSFYMNGKPDCEFGSETASGIMSVTGKDYVDESVWRELIGGVC